MYHDNTCQKCKTEQGNEAHGCPFVFEVYGGEEPDDPSCNCCDACTEECACSV